MQLPNFSPCNVCVLRGPVSGLSPEENFDIHCEVYGDIDFVKGKCKNQKMKPGLKAAIVDALKHMKKHNAISLKKNDDYVVFGYNKDCKYIQGKLQVKLREMIEDGWVKVD